MSLEKIYATAQSDDLTRKYEFSSRLIRAVAIIILIGISYLTYARDIRYSLLALFPILLLIFNWQSNTVLKDFINLKKIWGKQRNRKRNLENSQKEWQKKAPVSNIDNQTWQDLDLDSFYEQLDRTFTTPGESVLYRFLREPLEDNPELLRRDQLIQAFTQNAELREKLSYVLISLGREKHHQLPELLSSDDAGKLPGLISKLYLFPLFSVAFLISYVIWQFDFLLYGICAMLPLNWWLFSYCAQFYTHRPSELRYAQKMAASLADIAILPDPNFVGYAQEAKKLYASLNAFAGKKIRTTASFDGFLNFFNNVINIYLLLESVSYFKVVQLLKKQHNEFCRAYELIGSLDALLSAASFKTELVYTCQPEFSRDASEVQAKDFFHPLIANCVANDLQIDLKKSAGFLVSGSNMAGKSTLLRTVGLNFLLGQTFYFCTAKEFKAPFCSLFTSLCRSDSLMTGKSLFYTEAERLLTLIKKAESKNNCLFLIDEILTGTNTRERILAARAIISFLDKRGIVLITTHDQELIDQHDCRLEECFFSDYMNDKGELAFDYKLKQGRLAKTNALQILHDLGYPAEILDMTHGNC